MLFLPFPPELGGRGTTLEASLSKAASQANLKGDGVATEPVSDSESPGLSDPESLSDSKGEGNCGSHKRWWEIGHVVWGWREMGQLIWRGGDLGMGDPFLRTGKGKK